MKTENLLLQTDAVREYSLVAHPDAEVHEKVMAEKKLFYHEYEEKIALDTKPHITVATFFAKEPMEATIIRWMENIFNKQQSFRVTLNNYSGIPAHTIYLRVQNPTPFQQLVKELQIVDTYLTSCLCPPMKRISNPFVSIAGSLPDDIYFRALTQYSHKLFHESFVVNELLLLRRNHQYDISKPVNVFGLPPGRQ